MAKTATVTKTKAATKTANDKKTRTPKADKADKADKPKREPTAYQLFCKAHMKKWNDENPGRSKEAMGMMAKLWKDAPENPNRGGGEPKARKPKVPKAATEPKAAKAKATKAKTPKKKADDEEKDTKPLSDPMEGEDDPEDAEESDAWCVYFVRFAF
ncbi:hypothetical protein H0H87_005098 [Tephrocybe sp. NHM501043]|nr:hypothetical protein H0H87_005098 [Tephrocybe sp. NHM501043]